VQHQSRRRSAPPHQDVAQTKGLQNLQTPRLNR
jgi:hypothetical protein